jgi:transcriptional regulator with XRE-family HTH domain
LWEDLRVPGDNEGVVPDLIKQARQAAGMSQDALAEATDVAQQTVAKWESGERRPKIEHLVAMAQVLPNFDALEVVLLLWPDLRGPGPTGAP